MACRTALLALSLAAALAAPAVSAQDGIDRINGSISAEAGQAYGSLTTVNGSIRIGDRATLRDATTVNGSVRAGDEVGAGSLETVNGSIRTGERVTLSGHARTVNGSIFVDSGGDVGRDVETVNGPIGLVRTQVGGDVTTVGGDITIGVGSHVRGSVRVHKPTSNWMPFKVSSRTPRIIVGPGAQVDGSLVFEREVVLYVHESARTGTVTGATAVRYSGDTAPRD